MEFPRYPQGGVAVLDGLLVLGCCPVGLLGNGPSPLFRYHEHLVDPVDRDYSLIAAVTSVTVKFLPVIMTAISFKFQIVTDKMQGC